MRGIPHWLTWAGAFEEDRFPYVLGGPPTPIEVVWRKIQVALAESLSFTTREYGVKSPRMDWSSREVTYFLKRGKAA